MTTFELSTLRHIQRADVYKAGERTALLERDPTGAVTFSYREGYSGPAVASTLPVTADRVTTPGGGLPPFFAGLLPEGHRLTVLRRAVKTSPDDELSLLLAVGADTPGDVQVVPAGEQPTDPPPLAATSPAHLDLRALTGAPHHRGRARRAGAADHALRSRGRSGRDRAALRHGRRGAGARGASGSEVCAQQRGGHAGARSADLCPTDRRPSAVSAVSLRLAYGQRGSACQKPGCPAGTVRTLGPLPDLRHPLDRGLSGYDDGAHHRRAG